jgi:prephenate dehydrogenase
MSSIKNNDAVGCVIGVGLIGGSMALALKQHNICDKIIGVDANEENLKQALALKIIDEYASLENAVAKSDLIFIAIPVDATVSTAANVLNLINDKQIVFDAGSTKFTLCDTIKNHTKRKQFVATHPMWGTEFSGPQAAVQNAFINRACVICDKENSSDNALQVITNLYEKLGMHIIHMDAAAHDVHAAYVSHISHITSFALANTVLEKEKEEDAIFEMAGGGFESTVRLAKSNPAMWLPIFMQNKENVLDVLNEHISQLRKFKASLEKDNGEYLKELMNNANKIKRILPPPTTEGGTDRKII